MTKNKTEQTYLRAGIQSASSVQLVIILYDFLIGALMDAVSAMDRHNIEERSTHLKRAFLVLEQMEQSLDMEAGGEAAKNLAHFYAALRANIINAHAEGSRAGLEHQIQLVFQVRGAWSTVDRQASAGNSAPSSPPPHLRKRMRSKSPWPRAGARKRLFCWA